ncbi:hypothetical protein FRC02_010544 [Tulasnella sp. 418]|nr:hypothetical protein FRC02_010544 [Tulasnella sp. 418]
MVQQQFKETTIVIIDTGRRQIKAGRGLHELLPAPTVYLDARVGLRKADATRLRSENGGMEVDASAASSSKLVPPKGLRPSSYLVGTRLDEAVANGDELEIYWPFEDGLVSDFTQAEALWQVLVTMITADLQTHHTLDRKYILFETLQLRRTLNEFPVLLSLPKRVSNDAQERLAQLFFERFNVAAFCLNERPLMQLFAANQMSGIVVDIDDFTTDVTPIVEAFPSPSGTLTIPLGADDCEKHLASILYSNNTLISAISPPASPLSPENLHATLLRLARHLWMEGHIKPNVEGVPIGPTNGTGEEDDGGLNIAAALVTGKEKAIIEASNKKKASAVKGAAEREREKERERLDIIEIEFEGVKITLGKERHRFCEPLLEIDILKQLISSGQKDLVTSMTIASAVNSAVMELDIPSRAIAWDGGVFVTGKLSRIKALGAALHSHLKTFIVRDPTELGIAPNGQPYTTDQPRSFRIIKVPEYFANYRDSGDELAAFLGCSIVAKLTFNDPSGKFLSKSAYSAQGPSAILEFV